MVEASKLIDIIHLLEEYINAYHRSLIIDIPTIYCLNIVYFSQYNILLRANVMLIKL